MQGSPYLAFSETPDLGRGRDQRHAEDITDGEDAVGEASGHGGRALTIVSLSPWGRFAQRLVRTGQVVVQAEPLGMEQQVLLRGQRPGLAT